MIDICRLSAITTLSLLLAHPTIGNATVWTPPQTPTGPDATAPLQRPDSVPPASSTDPEDSDTPPETPAIETLYMQDGSFVRGTIIERVDGDHIVIEVAGTSEQREIPWNELKIAEPESPLGEISDDTEDGVHVHIEVTGRKQALYDITLEAITGTATERYYDAVKGKYRQRSSHVTEPVCLAPCDRVVPVEGSDGFIVSTRRKDARSNAGAIISRQVEFPAMATDVNLRVRPGRKGFLYGGVGLMAAGAIGLIGMAVLMSKDASRGATAATAATSFIGIGAGITLMFMSPTRVSVGS